MSEIWTPETADLTKINITFDPRKDRMVGTTAHGNFPFDVPYISEIADNLWQGGCANGLVLPKEIVHLISLYPWETYSIISEIRSVLSVVMYDSLDQSYEQIDGIADWVNTCRSDGPTLVHCQAGLNRSSLVVARSLMFNGMSATDAIALLREKRSPAVLCNTAFETWLLTVDQ